MPSRRLRRLDAPMAIDHTCTCNFVQEWVQNTKLPRNRGPIFDLCDCTYRRVRIIRPPCIISPPPPKFLHGYYSTCSTPTTSFSCRHVIWTVHTNLLPGFSFPTTTNPGRRLASPHPAPPGFLVSSPAVPHSHSVRRYVWSPEPDFLALTPFPSGI